MQGCKAYRLCSVAVLNELGKGWDEVNVLIQMAEQIGTDDDKYNVLCRAAIVLVVANLEGCLQEIIRCLIDDININNAFSISSNRMKRTFCESVKYFV